MTWTECKFFLLKKPSLFPPTHQSYNLSWSQISIYKWTSPLFDRSPVEKPNVLQGQEWFIKWQESQRKGQEGVVECAKCIQRSAVFYRGLPLIIPPPCSPSQMKCVSFISCWIPTGRALWWEYNVRKWEAIHFGRQNRKAFLNDEKLANV